MEVKSFKILLCNRHSCESSSSSIIQSSSFSFESSSTPCVKSDRIDMHDFRNSGATAFAASGRYDRVILKYSFAIILNKYFCPSGKLFADPEDTELLKYEFNFGKIEVILTSYYSMTTVQFSILDMKVTLCKLCKYAY